ncbi:MAG: hypothetical protein NZ553_13595, partial [Caldilinea sp.]|nr:hypothetical protein [Caldilinea sp.]MDW8441506.1 hypothetical protein [Caldilineaceae bacterium]
MAAACARPASLLVVARFLQRAWSTAAGADGGCAGPQGCARWGGGLRLAGGTPYRGQHFHHPKTVTSYDGFGRVSKVQSPTAGEAVTVTYPADLQVQ